MASRGPDESKSTIRGAPIPRAGRLCLLVIGENISATYPLPETGELVIGRGRRVDVPIEDGSISRRHAVLRVRGDAITIEDLGSANGTRVRGDQPLASGDAVPVAVGDVLDVGSVMLIVQSRPSGVRPRRLWPHDYFEGRLEDECVRAERESGAFTVARLHCTGGAPPPGVVEEVLAESLRATDVAGTYGPGEYELLLGGDTAADAVLAAIEQRLAERRLAVTVGVARYPGDGRGPDALLDRAGSLARGIDSGRGAVAPIAPRDAQMSQLNRLVERIARGQINVLVLGETGAGKEVLAERVHRLSPRSAAPFLRLNCAALSETLLESELFGHERGAFTGAVAAKPGLLETAEGGTVFLDEVGELPMTIQAKLLRVIETRQVLRVGGLKAKTIDVRFIAATNRDLEAESSRGAFRQDLYFRLNGVTLVVPPLRERVAEIADLARAFAADAAQQLEAPVAPTIAKEAMAMLESYSWPGNIRELRNVMERAVLLSPDGKIGPGQLPVEKMRATVGVRASTIPPPSEPAAPPRHSAPTPAAAGEDEVDALRRRIDELEKERILEALNRFGGNQTRAAKLLGMPRRTLVSRLGKYALPRPRDKG